MITSMITVEQLVKIMPYARGLAPTFIEPLNKTMDEFEINTAPRIAAFLAQIGHESGQLRYVKELASGSAYEGRKDLGNNLPGDGRTYKGRGLIQITGKLHYTEIMLDLNLDCLAHPEILELPENACRVSGWFWKRNGLNELADTGDFLKITKIINGGVNGLADRQALYDTAKKVLRG